MISKKKFLKALGARIRKLREAKGLTQNALSSRMDKETQSLQRVERGVINPSVYYLLEVAEALEMKLSDIVDLEK